MFILVFVLFVVFHRLSNHNKVVQFAEQGVVGTGAAHVDDTFLEAYDLAGGNDGHAAQNVGLAGTNGIDLSDDAGELSAGAFDLNAGLDHVFYRGNTNALAGTGNVKAEGFDPLLYIVVGIEEISDRIGVNVKSAVFYFAFLCKLDVIDLDETKFQFQSKHLLFFEIFMMIIGRMAKVPIFMPNLSSLFFGKAPKRHRHSTRRTKGCSR